MTYNRLHKTKRFIIPILSLVIISIISIAAISTYLNISMFKTHMYNDVQKHKQGYLQKNKNEVYQKVHLVNNSIKFQITKIENKLKKSLKERIKTSLNIAQYIYDKQKGKISNEEIKERIAEHLDAMRFNENRGYYFTYDYNTNIVIRHAIKKFIGRNMTNFKDLKGQILVNLYSNVLAKDNIAFAKIYFNKPSDKNKEYPKIVCLTKFEPLNMVIGTGEYLDTIEKQIKQYVIDRFTNMKKDKHRYLFFLNLHNINGGDNFATMILNPNRPDLIGKKINDTYKDAKGKEFRKEFLYELRKNGESYTKYWYKKPDIQKPKPKMSYFYLQKDWNWILASGFYYDDLQKQINKMETSLLLYTNQIIKRMILWVGLFSLIMIAIATFVSIQIDKIIQKYTDQIVTYKDKERKQENLLIEQAKMAQMGEMIGNIAHQWRQPLSVISTSASGLQLEKEVETLDDKKFKLYTDGILRNTEFLSNTIDTFRNYIKEKKEIKTVILQDRINSSIDIIETSLKNTHIKLIKHIDNIEPIEITMIVGELSQVIINLINNAKDILVENKIDDKIITINLKRLKDTVMITVEDNGGGIPEEVLPKIFNPYFTTKHQSQGTGLGLYMSKEIIEKHLKGNLTAKNDKYGAIFTIELPLT